MGNSFTYTHVHALELLKPTVVHVLFDYVKQYSVAATHTHNSATIQVPISTFFFIEELCTIQYSVTEHKATFRYIIDYKKFSQFILFFIIASALFSTFSVSFFLWFCGISLLVFYGIRSIYVHSFISGVISHITIQQTDEDILRDEQQRWIENPHVCPACGTEINDYTSNCSECGLFIKHMPPVSRFSVSENLDTYNLQYTITNEKD